MMPLHPHGFGKMVKRLVTLLGNLAIPVRVLMVIVATSTLGPMVTWFQVPVGRKFGSFVKWNLFNNIVYLTTHLVAYD